MIFTDSLMRQGAIKFHDVIVIQNRYDGQAVNTRLGIVLLDLRPEFREMVIAKSVSLQIWRLVVRLSAK